MRRSALPVVALLAAALFALGCGPVTSTQSDPFRGASPGDVALVRVLNLDWDVKTFWGYCDGRQVVTLRDIPLQRHIQEILPTNCRHFTFKTEGQGGEMLFSSPPLEANAGFTLDITLMESGRARWRWGD